MTGLAAVLSGQAPAGVYRWHAAYDVADLRHEVEHAGWRFASVDGWAHGSKAAFLTAVGESLGFAEHYGRNLDALHDCLRDLDTPTVLVWDGWSALARGDEATFTVVTEIFDAWRDRLVVLLSGEGPDLPLSALG